MKRPILAIPCNGIEPKKVTIVMWWRLRVSPIPRSKHIKPDRFDAAQLAKFYAHGLLAFVSLPEPVLEQDRDLMRSCQNLLQQQTKLCKPLRSLLRRKGLHYRAQTHNKTHWTTHHDGWLERTINDASGSLKVNLELLLRHLNDQQIGALATTPRYEKPVQASTCYKGIKHLFVLTMISEIGDINRFPHPRQLVSWISMDIREYSSGGNHHRFGITKPGNRYWRTVFIEANQLGYRTAKISKEIKARRAHTATEFVDIADCCLRRLNKNGNRLLPAEPPNKVKVAWAREMVGFI